MSTVISWEYDGADNNARGGEAGVGVADNEGGVADAALPEALREVAPMDFGMAALMSRLIAPGRPSRPSARK